MAPRHPALTPQYVAQVAGDAGLGGAPRLTGPLREVDGGADPAEAARVQLTVLLALLGVELVAASACALFVARACEAPGERLALAGRTET